MVFSGSSPITTLIRKMLTMLNASRRWVIFDRFRRLCLPVHVRFAPKAAPRVRAVVPREAVLWRRKEGRNFGGGACFEAGEKLGSYLLSTVLAFDDLARRRSFVYRF
jgi:hypothetical protein